MTAHLRTDVVAPGSDMSPPVTQAAGTRCPLPHMPGVPSPATSPRQAQAWVGWGRLQPAAHLSQSHEPICWWNHQSVTEGKRAFLNVCPHSMISSLQHLYFWDLELESNQGALDPFTPLYRVVTACELSKLVNSTDQMWLSANRVDSCWAIT